MNNATRLRIASVLLVLHGLIEISALFTLKAMAGSLISFGGLDRAQIAANNWGSPNEPT